MGSTYVQLSIHSPRPGKEALVIDSMHRFQTAIKNKPGMKSATTFKDRKSGRLVGIAIWDSWESMNSARPAMVESTKNDRFDEWEESEMETFQLDEVY